MLKNLKFLSMSDKYKFSNVWKMFTESTTIHGLIYIFRTKFPWKTMWIVVWFLMFVCVLYFSIQSIYQYYRYEVKTMMVYNTVPEIAFPAITLCNQFSMMKKTRNEPVLFMASILLGNPDSTTYNKVLNQVGSNFMLQLPQREKVKFLEYEILQS